MEAQYQNLPIFRNAVPNGMGKMSHFLRGWL
jgi:hypothetical protein